ncbi:unnamed protein product [Paramecium primaurelia]|uniref:Uncharacterized protein n=1 Tax=Paramecium primaurelia TaxID=5886 RepID=A0A8S1LT74_PARPR|nr:unnamed protein product [Paramecium primaurelia]
MFYKIIYRSIKEQQNTQYLNQVQKNKLFSQKKRFRVDSEGISRIIIEESSSITLIERIMKIIGDISIDESIKNVADEKLNQSQLIIEQEKYENVQQQLRIVEKNNNCNKIEYFKNFIIQIDKVVRLLKNSIIKIYKFQLLNNLQEKQEELKRIDKKNDEVKRNYKSHQLNNQQYEIDVKDQYKIEKSVNNFLMKNVKQIYQSSLIQQKQQLTQLFQEVKQFRNIFLLLQDYNKEIQRKTTKVFLNYLQEQINKFSQSLWTTSNIQQIHNESFKEILKKYKSVYYKFKMKKEQQYIRINKYL